MRAITKRVVGPCPETGRIQTVEIKFAEINLIGQPRPGYKATSYFCDYGSEHGCKNSGPNGMDCPLFKKGTREGI